MLDFQQKRKVRSFMYSRITLVVISILVLVVMHSTWRVYEKKRTSEELKNISIQYTEELRTRSEELEVKINRLDTVPGKEEEIRSRFNVVKDNENMVVIVPDVEDSVATSTVSESFWSKIKAYFSRN
ncbi:MAG: hypothetical protein EXS47_01500 [Candidatus Zambryskibacteria bacterium]|nr:hypothetical protein [Candidatus Zambryskibacteria bacterium]